MDCTRSSCRVRLDQSSGDICKQQAAKNNPKNCMRSYARSAAPDRTKVKKHTSTCCYVQCLFYCRHCCPQWHYSGLNVLKSILCSHANLIISINPKHRHNSAIGVTWKRPGEASSQTEPETHIESSCICVCGQTGLCLVSDIVPLYLAVYRSGC